MTNPLLLISLTLLLAGYMAISQLAAPQAPITIGSHQITTRQMYTTLGVIGFPMLWLAAPLSTVFWLVGASAIVVGGHAALMEPGLERSVGKCHGQSVSVLIWLGPCVCTATMVKLKEQSSGFMASAAYAGVSTGMTSLENV